MRKTGALPMTSAAFVIPGDIDLPTGGYAYDRRVLARLPAHGVAIEHIRLPGSFPFPSEADVAATVAAVAGLPQDTVLLIDGLAYGALPTAAVEAIRQPIVALCHHPLALEAGLDDAMQARLKASEIAALGLARHTIATSPMTKRILVTDFAQSEGTVTVAEPGTDRAQRATGSGGAPHLLAVGSIVPRKGYAVLVEALEALSHLDWRLTIVGAARDADTLAALETQISASGLGDRITLAGAQTDSELAVTYQSADVFVMPSLFEGYGMVLAEAMARGLPIVCTTGGAAAETAPDAAALKVAPGDAAAFGAALGRLLGDAGLRRQMAEASWAAGLMLPTWDDTTKIIAAVLSTSVRAPMTKQLGVMSK